MDNQPIYWEKWEEENTEFLQNVAVFEAEQIIKDGQENDSTDK